MASQPSHCVVDVPRMTDLTNGSYVEHACSSDTPTIYKLTTVAFAGRTDACEDVVIADSPTYGRMLFLEGELQSAETDQVIYHEMLVQPIMAATAAIPNRKVLVVGGGEGATVQEVLRCENVQHVVWIDIDEGLVNLCRRHLDWVENDVYNNPRVSFIAEDIRTILPRFGQFDVIILDLPDPDPKEVEPLGLYSRSFWELIYTHLAPGGALVTHTGPVAPGADEEKYRSGLHFVKSAQHVEGTAYHILIPSFQSEWGFWMSVPPTYGPFPSECSIIDEEILKTACTWSRYWSSSAVGTIRPL